MRLPPVRTAKMLLGWLAATGALCAGSARAQDDEPDAALDPIVVSGALQRGSAHTDTPPEFTVDRSVIRTLGTDSLSEIIELYAPQSEARRVGDEPILLLDGRRIGDSAEIDQLPPEAILRIEVFPEDVARQYGFPPDRKVVNVILRPRYRAIELQFRRISSFGEGRSQYRGKADLLRQSESGRLHLDLRYRYRTRLDDEDAEAVLGERWRLPQESRFSGSATYATSLGGLELTLSATGQREDSYWQLGETATFGALRRQLTEENARFGLTLASLGDNWRWTATSSLELGGERLATRDSAGMDTALAGYFARNNRQEAEVEFTASGPLFETASGQVNTTLGGGVALRSAEASDALFVPAMTEIRQDSGFVAASIDFPLLADQALVLFGEGRAVFADEDSLLGRYGIGLRGEPLAGLDFSASFSEERRLPEYDDLADLQIASPNVRLFDFAAGSEEYVSWTEGGNPLLRPERNETIAARVQWIASTEPRLALSLDFSDVTSHDSVSEALGLTPQVEAALPLRIVRAAGGELVSFDRRPVNLAFEHRRQLRSAVNFSTPAPHQWQVALYHTWTLQHDVRIGPGSPTLNLFEGAAVGDEGGTSRHRFEAQLGYASGKFGVRLSAQWQGPRDVWDTSLYSVAAGNRLRFSQGMDLDFRLFLDLRKLRDQLGLEWLDGRVYLAVDNILASRNRILDQQGNAVDFYRENAGEGRVIRTTFRKMFY